MRHAGVSVMRRNIALHSVPDMIVHVDTQPFPVGFEMAWLIVILGAVTLAPNIELLTTRCRHPALMTLEQT